MVSSIVLFDYVKYNFLLFEQSNLLQLFLQQQVAVRAVIDDEVGKTLAAASSRENGIENEKITKIEQAAKVGALIAEKAKAAGIEAVVFDRNGYLYHGRVKSLADAARNGGLKF